MIEPASIDVQRKARSLYWQQWRVTDIADHLGVPRTTISSWISRGKWDDAPAIARIECSTEERYNALIRKEEKTGRDFKEIDLLGRQLERLARVRRYEQPGGHEGDLNQNLAKRNAGPRRKPVRNDFSDEQRDQLIDAFRESLFGYQKRWHAAGSAHRIRNILKARQIGATWYFAREALIDAIETGRNQIFLSASRAQAHVFRQYIVSFAKEVGVDLTGDPIVLPNEASLYFLGTNFRTAQSYHGNLYFDEYFWVHQFQTLRKVASGMAMHKRWRQTYFSTPSSMAHGAYPFWSGEQYNRGRRKEDRISIDVSHSALADGAQCDDGQWRQIVTVEDAVRGGCDLFDIQQLSLEYSADEWANLLMCEFIDDTASVFGFAELQACGVDSWEQWADFKPFSLRPLGNREVWVGYDPSLNGDGAGCVVVAPPAVPGGKFRCLEKHQWRGMDFASQADSIKRITERYRVTHIGIDASGVGAGVFQLVRQFFPTARNITYSVDVKTRLVLKAKDVIARRRLEFDAGWTDLVQSFLSIRKTMTASGRQATFEAGRNEDIGHADLAWALMHALDNEPLEGHTKSNKSVLEIF